MSNLRESIRAKLTGSALGITTPFLDNGDIDEEGLRRLVDYYVENGFNFIIAGGTHGEVFSLTEEERKRVMRITVEQAAGRAVIGADVHHIGCLKTVISLSQYAEEIGADIAYCMTPYFWRVTDEALFDFYKELSESVKSIGVMLCTNPYRTHVRLKPSVIKKLVDRFENIVAIKAADPDVADLSDTLAVVGDDIVVITGWEVHVVHGSFLGSPCYFGNVGNFDPSFEHKYEKAFMDRNYEELRRLHFLLSPVRRFYQEVDVPMVMKTAQELIGIPGGPVRLPLRPMTDEQEGRLKKILKNLGTI